MLYLLIKAAISGVVVAAASEVARRNPGVGGMVASLPIVSILSMIWLWRDTGDLNRVADHAQSTFWFVLPSLPMFLLTPALIKRGTPFWIALAFGMLLTICLYGLSVWIWSRVAVRS